LQVKTLAQAVRRSLVPDFTPGTNWKAVAENPCPVVLRSHDAPVRDSPGHLCSDEASGMLEFNPQLTGLVPLAESKLEFCNNSVPCAWLGKPLHMIVSATSAATTFLNFLNTSSSQNSTMFYLVSR